MSIRTQIEMSPPSVRRATTHGSGWMVQAQPTKQAPESLPNPTHGSGWLEFGHFVVKYQHTEQGF